MRSTKVRGRVSCAGNGEGVRVRSNATKTRTMFAGAKIVLRRDLEPFTSHLAGLSQVGRET
jgi:hypothetical protein